MASNINLANGLSLTQGFLINGTNSGSQLGSSVSNVGDINGDGYTDIVIGAPGPGGVNTSYGLSFVIYGKNYDLDNIDLSNLNVTQGFNITGFSDIRIGQSVNGVVDINGDGYDEIIIGGYNPNETGGIAYLILGQDKPSNIQLTSTFSQGYTFTGIAGVAVGGTYNSNVGNLIIGSPYSADSEGISYIICGNSLTAVGSVIDVSNLTPSQGISIIGPDTSEGQIGYSVAGLRDINGDGYNDIAIGGPYHNSNHGICYIIFGNSSGFSNINLGTNDLVSTGQGFSITGAHWGWDLGWSVNSAGDFNKDGYDDIIIGSPYASPNNRTWAGIAYIIYGNSSGFVNIDLSTTDLYLSGRGFSLIGANSGDQLGWSVDSAGDLNGDGYYDVVIGAIGATGISYVIYGKDNQKDINFATNSNLSSSNQGFYILGEKIGDYFGWSVSSAGDINNDGFSDVIIGAPNANSQSGTTYVIYGYANPTANPTSMPSKSPTLIPSSTPSDLPTTQPSIQPSDKPTSYPNSEPTATPSAPTNFPSSEPSCQPSLQPIADPTSYPTSIPTSKPTKPYKLILNYNVETAIYSTVASALGGIILYLAPSFILKNWGYKFKYIYSELDKESLKPYEIGLLKKNDDSLVALHKKNNAISEYLLETSNGINNAIPEILYKLIVEQLEHKPLFDRNPASSYYKYIYNLAEARNLKANEIGIKVIGKLPLLSCDIFCNSEKLIAFKRIGDEIKEIPINTNSNTNNVISKALFHSIAREYIELSNSVFVSSEENQLRDFLLVPDRMMPSINVFQKVFCLYTPVYKDLGKAPGLIHNALNCNGHGPEFFYNFLSIGGTIPGFLYGLCHTFLKKYQVGVNSRIAEHSLTKIDLYIDYYLKADVGAQTITNVIHQEKKDDLEARQIGSDIDNSLLGQESNYVEMIDSAKNHKSTCIIQAVYKIEFNDPIINKAYHKRLGLESLKELTFLSEEADVKQIAQGDNFEFNKAESSSFNTADSPSPNFILSYVLNVRKAIEYIPLIKHLCENILYPLVENFLPESVKNISSPEILDSKVFLFTAHLGLGYIGTTLLPADIISKGLIASTAGSAAFGIRLTSSHYLSEYRQDLALNQKSVDVIEGLKYCAAIMFTYTVSAFATCALAQIVMPGYPCNDLALYTKLSFAGAECYSAYKATQGPIISTTTDVVIPYIADGIAVVFAYANSYSPMTAIASVVTADWMSRLIMDMVSKEVKENYIDPIFDYALQACSYGYETINQIIGITEEL